MPATSRLGAALTPIFRDAYPRHASKRAAQAAEVPYETARAWVKGYATPSAAVLLRMAARCDDFASALERRLVAAREARALDRATAAGGGVAPAAVGKAVTR